MHKKSVVFFVFLFVVQALSAGLAVVPQESSTDTWQGPVLESGARSVGVLTDSQQQSMLYNQSYNGSNDNDGDGVVNSLDSDDDNDCIPDTNDSSPYDFDGDGINDESDIDDDGDGLNDSLEVSDTNSSTNIYDADNDGNHDCAFFSTGNYSGGNNSGGNNSGGNNSGGNNTNTSTGCGYDVNYTSVSTYSPYMVMENQSFSTTIYVNCEVYNSTMDLVYLIYDSSNYTVYSGNQSWTSMNNYSNFNWSVPGLSIGNYTFYAQLYVGGSYNDSSSSGIVVYTNSSGGGGNNSGNQTSPCGYNPSYTSVNAYSPSMIMENQSFMTSIYVNCEIYNSNMLLAYWIYDAYNYTVYSGNQSWTGANNNSNFNWSVGGLSVGNYTFHAELYVNGTFADSDSDGIMVYANNSGGGGNTGNTGCGYDLNYTFISANVPSMVMENQSFMTSVYVNCEIYNTTMLLNYWIYDANNYTVSSGNHSWTGMNNSSHWNWSIGGLSAGNYTFDAELYTNGTFVASNYGGIMVYANNSGGGGNNGGNNTVNDAHCLILHNLTMSQSYYVTVNLVNTCNDAINYPGINGYTENTQVSGLSNSWWYVIGGNNSSGLNNSITMNWQLYFSPNLTNGTMVVIGLEATVLNCGSNNSWGHQCPNSTDSSLSYQFTFIGNTNTNNTGGNNTGGNNTGGNNTGGNNTGGNNTGGNNTGGNNTGGNNTGGNNTGGNNTGGNNTGGNTSNPCGSDLNYSTLMVGAYQLMTPMLYENDTFTGSFRPMCALNQMDHSFTGHLQGPNANDYSSFSVDIYLPGGQAAIATQYQSWLYLEVGFYSFHVEWNLNQSGTQTFVDEGWFNFTVIANNTNSPGSSQSNPLMPFNCSDINWNATGFTLQDCQNNPDSFWFVFNNTGGTFWIDPVVAIGYDYIVWSGPNIRSVTLPTGYGDDIYDLYMWNSTEWYDTGINIDGGETYTFTDKFGVDRLSIRGIEASEELDPNNPTAFVTGLSFTTTNEVMMTMTPVTVNYTSNNTGGNNTGGNNTGGDNTGGNNTGGNNTVIPNTAPSVSGVSISPVLTTADDTLTCAYTVIDLDGDITTATVTWSVNGNIILTGSDSLTGGFAVGDDVVCSVIATDGQQPSTAASASTVILPVPNVDSEDGEGLPALGTIGTMAAIAAGVFASRRKDE